MRNILTTLSLLLLSLIAYPQYSIPDFPQFNETWQRLAFYQAVDSVGKLAEKDRPTLKSEDRRRFFERLLDRRNLDYFLDHKEPVDERMQSMIYVMAANKALFTFYYTGLVHKQNSSEEFARVLAFLVHTFGTCFDLTEEFRLSIGAKAEEPVRKKGLDEMRLGLSEELSGILLMLRDPKTFTDNQREFILDALVEEMPRLNRYLPDAARENYRHSLDDMIRVEDDKGVSAKLKKLKTGFTA